MPAGERSKVRLSCGDPSTEPIDRTPIHRFVEDIANQSRYLLNGLCILIMYVSKLVMNYQIQLKLQKALDKVAVVLQFYLILSGCCCFVHLDLVVRKNFSLT